MLKSLATLFLGATVVVNASAAAPADRINMLSAKGDWSVFEANKSYFSIADKTLTVTPTDTDAGATYVASSYRNAVIEFDYLISYDPEVEPYDENDSFMPGSFWGIIFGNNVTVDEKWQGTDVLPWSGRGGYPYMLCFDTERQVSDEDSPRYAQVGLSLRRYKVEGGHDYAARWSTVAPGDFEYTVSTGSTAYSVTPDFYKPVTVGDCFDTDKHSVKIDYRAQYKEQGGENDAVVVNVWFDGEPVLTVVDDMPFEGENWGVAAEVDKRDKDGYIGVFAHHASVTDVELYDWKLTVTDLFVTDLGDVSDPGYTPPISGGDSSGSESEKDGNGKGCGSVLSLTAGTGFIAAAGAFIALSGRKKYRD